MTDRCYITRCLFYWRIAEEKLSVGDSVRVVGSLSALGNWDYRKGVDLVGGKGTVDASCWFSAEAVYLPMGERVEYKYVVVCADGSVRQWEDVAENRFIVPTGLQMIIEDDEGFYRLNQQGFQFEESDEASTVAGAVEAAILQLKQNEVGVLLTEEDVVVYAAVQLPVRAHRDDNGNICVRANKNASTYPLLSARKRKGKPRMIFLGFVGFSDFKNSEEIRQLEKLLIDWDCFGVDLGENVDQSIFPNYRVFCDKFMWPIMNNKLPMYDNDWEDSFWNDYITVNKLFAKKAIEIDQNGIKLVWFNDFHLALAPKFIKDIPEKNKCPPIGLFLHSTFPSSDVFVTLPTRTEILVGLLSADLLGFQFFEYARHFLSGLWKLLGIKPTYKLGGFISLELQSGLFEEIANIGAPGYSKPCDPGLEGMADPVRMPPSPSGVIQQSRNVMLRVAHNSIQFDSIESDLASIEDIGHVSKTILIAGIDRLGDLSGMVEKFQAFKSFLAAYPQYRNRVFLNQIAIGKSQEEDHSEILNKVSEIVTRINSDFGTHCSFEIFKSGEGRRLALMAKADILLDCSLREGLNLAPLEYLAARSFWLNRGHDEIVDDPLVSECHATGRLIVSEGSGVSQVLGGAIRVNPWNEADIVAALDESIGLSIEEARGRFEKDVAYAKAYSQINWADEFVTDLISAVQSRKSNFFESLLTGTNNSDLPPPLDVGIVTKAYENASRRLFLLDNEGTLAPANSTGSVLLASRGQPPSPEVINTLRSLSSDPRNSVVILSGRDKTLLSSWFNDLDGQIGLAAEHGFLWKVPEITNAWRCSLTEGGIRAVSRWKELVIDLMMMFQKRTPKSMIENKGSAIVWQYRDSEQEFALAQAGVLHHLLVQHMTGYNVEITAGKGYVEVRLRGVNKGVAAQKILSELEKKGKIDFVFAAGDDRSDEAMFSALRGRPGIFSCTVGSKSSNATYMSPDPYALSDFLASLINS